MILQNPLIRPGSLHTEQEISFPLKYLCPPEFGKQWLTSLSLKGPVCHNARHGEGCWLCSWCGFIELMLNLCPRNPRSANLSWALVVLIIINMSIVWTHYTFRK